jgi:long-chain acyl-CoA synthetase
MVDFRRRLAGDASVGAGNFFYRFAGFCMDPEATILECDQPFVIGGWDYGRELSVATVASIADHLVMCLMAHGLRAHDPVGVFISDDPRYYLYYIALTRMGAIPVMVNSKMPGATAADYMRRVGCAAVIVDRERADRIAPHTAALSASDGSRPQLILAESIRFSERVPDYHPYRHSGSDAVLIAHTSGTTGAPKPVRFNHSGYFFGVRQQMSHVLGPRVLSALPHSHGAAITMFMSTVIRGVPLRAQTQKDPQALLEAIENWRPNLVMAFPKPLVDLCRAPLDEHDLSSVSCWMSTGDASHEPHIRRLVDFGSRMLAGKRVPGSLYVDNLGSSEFAFGIFRNVHSPETSCYDRCIGRPFEWVDVRIFGEDGRPVPVGQVGRLGVRSPSVTTGYWNDCVTTNLTRLDGYWLTGDLVFQADNGLYYHVDRTVDRALCGNRAVYSCQLEELLLKHVPEIFDCTVVGVDGGAERARPSQVALAIAVEPIEPACDRMVLETRIASVLENVGITGAVRIEYVAPDWNEGLTGKKLKRVIRDTLKPELRTPAAT